MFGKRFFGLRGPKLNYAISIIAGIGPYLYELSPNIVLMLITPKISSCLGMIKESWVDS